MNIDVVAIYNQETKIKLFENAKILKAQIKESSTAMTHPVETGVTVTDHLIVNPTEISMSLMLNSSDYKTVYASINKARISGTFLSIQTKSTIYKNIIITDMPHDENADTFNAIPLALRMKEVFIVVPTVIKIPKPKNPQHGNTVNKGTQQGTKKESLALSAYKGIFK